MRACLGILLLALLLRALHAWQMASSPLYDEPAVDGMTYVAHAEALAAGDWLGRDRPAFWQPPLYPYVLGLVKTDPSPIRSSTPYAGSRPCWAPSPAPSPTCWERACSARGWVSPPALRPASAAP